MIFKNNKIYDALKWFALSGVGIISTFIIGLGLLYGFDTHYIVGTLELVGALIGGLIGVSGIKYAKAKATTDNERNDENGAE